MTDLPADGWIAIFLAVVAILVGAVEVRRTAGTQHDGFIWMGVLLAFVPVVKVVQAFRTQGDVTEAAIVATIAGALTVLGLVVISRIAHAFERRFADADRPHASMLVGRLVRLVGAIPLVLGMASALQWDLTALLATAGVLGVAVGFAAQTSLSNLIAGIFLLFDRPFSIGDIVEIDGQQGTVREITLLSTHIRTFDNLLVRWPNQVVLTARIVNFSRFPARRIEMALRVPHEAPLEAVREALVAALLEEPGLLLEPTPEVRFKDMSDNGITLLVRAWAPVDGFLNGRDAFVLRTHRTLAELGVVPRVPAYEVHSKA